MSGVSDEDNKWITTFIKYNNTAEDASQILDWYKQASPKAENPYLVIEVKDNVKMIFKYIISGLINAQKINKDINLIETIVELINFYKDLKKEEQESEIIIFILLQKTNDLINEQNNQKNILYFDKSFMPIPINTIIDEESSKKDLAICSTFSSNKKIEIPYNYVNDFSEHFKPQLINLLGINEYLGVKNTENINLNISLFIEYLRNFITYDTIEKLNDLQELAESKPFDLELTYNYDIKIAYYWVNIILACLDFITTTLDYYNENINYTKVESYLYTKLKSIKDFIWLMVINGIYKYINRKGIEVPKNFFHNFLTYYDNAFSKSDIKKQCIVLKWFYSKLLNILKQSEILEIKTVECFYDLFDSIDLEKANIDTSGELCNKKYPLRTIHFRTDCIITSESISINGFQIKRAFWLHVDETVCWRQKPFSIFLGILNEATKLEPLFYTLLWELGPNFIDDNTMSNMAKEVGALQSTYCTEINVMNIPATTIRAPNDATNKDLKTLDPINLFNSNILLAAELFFTDEKNSHLVENILHECMLYKIEDFPKIPNLDNLTDIEINSYIAVENVLYELSKKIIPISENISDILTRDDFEKVNFPHEKVYQIHSLIQQKPSYVEINDVISFELYLIECINFHIEKRNNPLYMIDEQNIRLNINIVERYSHILFNIDYFNALKAYLQLKSKENLNNLNVIYKELAKNQTVVNKLHYALKEMEYKFTIASRDNYINACKNFNLDTNLEQIKQQNIYIAAKSELLRNSTEENRNILYNTKEYVSLVYNENDVKRVMSEAARIKMEANLSLQSIDEYKQVMKSLKMAYSSIISTPNIVILNMMPHEEEREMTLPYYEAKTELASTIMTLEKDINKLNISKFIIAFNNVFKLIDNNSKEKWITYYNNVLFSKIQNLRVAFYSGEYTNTYDIIKLIIDKLRDFNFENEQTIKAINTLNNKIDEDINYIIKYLYDNITIDIKMPNEDKDIIELNTITFIQHSLIDYISPEKLTAFNSAIESMVSKKSINGQIELSNKWKDYHFNLLYMLLKCYISRQSAYMLYTERVEDIVRVFYITCELKRLTDLYSKHDLDDGIDLLLETFIMQYENYSLLRPVENSVIFDNPVLPAYDTIIDYLASKLKQPWNDIIPILINVKQNIISGNVPNINELISKINNQNNYLENKDIWIMNLSDISKLYTDTGYTHHQINIWHKFVMFKCIMMLEKTDNAINNFFKYVQSIENIPSINSNILYDAKKTAVLTLFNDTTDCNFLKIMKKRRIFSRVFINLLIYEKMECIRQKSLLESLVYIFTKFSKDIIDMCKNTQLFSGLEKYSKDGLEIKLNEITYLYNSLYENSKNISNGMFIEREDNIISITNFYTEASKFLEFINNLEDTKLTQYWNNNIILTLWNNLLLICQNNYDHENRINKLLELLISKTSGIEKLQLQNMYEDYKSKVLNSNEFLIQYKNLNLFPDVQSDNLKIISNQVQEEEENF
jgi:hypothetical protein